MPSPQTDHSVHGDYEQFQLAPAGFDRKCQILWSLLKYPERTTGELADDCGFQGKGRCKYDYVKRELKDLIAETPYLATKKKKPPQTRTATYYRICRDRGVILQLYTDPKFTVLREHFWQSNWLREFLVATQKDFTADDLKADMLQMLAVSPTFFDLYLRKGIGEDEQDYEDGLSYEDCIRSWSGLIEYPIPSDRWFTETYVPKMWNTPDPNMLYNLFVFCMFRDYLPQYLDGTMDVEHYRLLEQMGEKSSQYRRTARAYRTSFQIMEALIAVRRLEEETGMIPKHLARMIDRYAKLRDDYEKQDELIPGRDADLDKQYNKIAEILDLDVVRKWDSRVIADFAAKLGITVEEVQSIAEDEYNAELECADPEDEDVD